jgi:hypothetical protein
MKYYAALGGMSTAELQQSMAKIRYVQERDNFMASLPDKLRVLYDETERTFYLLNDMDTIEKKYKGAPSVSSETSPTINNEPGATAKDSNP